MTDMSPPNSPQSHDAALDQRVADLLNAVFVAPKSRTGRRWKVTGRVLQGRLQLSPQGITGGFGGVKAIWKTLDELSTWERVK